MTPIRNMKIGDIISCSKCNAETPLTSYMVRAQTRICPKCRVLSAVAWADANRLKKRAANAAYHKRISGRRSESTARYRENNPEKRSAHQAVQTAIRNGSLVKMACTVCGAPKSHAHHDDYSKPLEVIWLCHTHHMDRHAMLKARGEDRSHEGK